MEIFTYGILYFYTGNIKSKLINGEFQGQGHI